MSTPTGTDYCPCCGHIIEAATNVDSELAPDPGDVTICLYCCNLLMFSDDMQLIKFPKVLFSTLSEEMRGKLSKVQQAIALAKLTGRDLK
jgi:hypothetical protein